ncbi:MAG: hypothetical protein R3296_07515 [Oleiphilaceae bacterium]|nr:hypothetical protein [Oleiphilaceae bacterium]
MYKSLWVVMLCGLAGVVSAESLRDPTRPPQSSADGPAQTAATPAMTLESILYSENRRVAVIDGVALREGQTLGEARVLRIHPKRVELQINQNNRTLRLDSGQSVRQSPDQESTD